MQTQRRKSWFESSEAIAAKRGDFSKIFSAEPSHAEKLKHNLRVFRKERDDDDDDDRKLNIADLSDEQLATLADQLDETQGYDDSGNRVSEHDLGKIASLVAEAHGIDRPAALRWLMHNKNGAALAHRLKKAINNKRKDQPTMGKMETLRKYVGASGMLPLAKYITDTNGKDVKLTEAQFTELATAAACKAHPALSSSPDRAFAKYFGDHQVLREAHRVVKGLALTLPLQIGGQAAIDSADTDEADALEQIMRIVEAQRAISPAMAKLSPEQVFAKVYQDPANRHLAQAERRQARARLG